MVLIADNNKLIGYHGYTHRGGTTFKIGDRLFDANYKPKEDNYEEWEWAGWKNKYDKSFNEGDDLDKIWMNCYYIFISFNCMIYSI